MEQDYIHMHNGSLHRCGLGYLPIVYYSLLLCLGLPGNKHVFSFYCGVRSKGGGCTTPEISTVWLQCDAHHFLKFFLDLSS